MKIAVCFSGQPRFLNECYKNIHKNLIDGYDVDVYAHGWWDESYKGKTITWEAKEKYSEEIDNAELFKELYKPVNAIFEPQIDFNKNLESYNLNKNKVGMVGEQAEIFVRKSLFVHLSQFYSIMCADQLRASSGKKYDLVVRARTDLLFKEKIKWEKYDPDFLHVADGRPVAGWGPFCDWFAFGGPMSIVHFSNLYNLYPALNRDGLIHIHDFVELALKIQGVKTLTPDVGCYLYRGHQKEEKHKPIDSYVKDLREGSSDDWPYFAKEWFGSSNGS